MGSKQLKRQERQRKRQQKQLIIGISVSVCVIIMIAVLVIFMQSRTTNVTKLTPDREGNLRISQNSIKKSLNYIDYGGPEELLVWQDGNGVIRTAFDTCESCYSLGSVRFTLSDEILTCNLCGTTQSISVLGTEEWGGCKPVSITPDMRNDTDTEAVIPAAVLSYAYDMFSHWNAQDFSVSLSVYGTDEAHTH